MPQIRRLAILALFVLASCATAPEQQTHAPSGSRNAGQTRVVKIVDGDTLWVLAKGKVRKKVRLFGIDAPERGQSFGLKSKQRLSELCAEQLVRLQVKEQDRYGRTLAEIFLSSAESVNQQMVSEGFAWWYQPYAPNHRGLREAQDQARISRRGLWSEPGAIAPWVWRQKNRNRTMKSLPALQIPRVKHAIEPWQFNPDYASIRITSGPVLW